MTCFEEEIESMQPASRHRAFGIDTSVRLTIPDDFAAAGFTLQEASVLTLSKTPQCAGIAALPSGFAFGTLNLPEENDLVVDIHVAVNAGRYHADGYREFATRQMDRYAGMQSAGLGHWFGLFAQVGGQRVLTASCGLFRDAGGAGNSGRFQFVTTHPDWRRRGLCTALVEAVCSYGFEIMGITTLVMVADPDDVAIHIYASLGFERGASTWLLEREPL